MRITQNSVMNTCLVLPQKRRDMTIKIAQRLLLLGCVLLGGVMPAFAHEMDLHLHVKGPHTIAGKLQYSDKSASAGEFIRVANVTDPSFSEFALQTDKAGEFVFAGVTSHTYAVTALGQEGHTVTVNIKLATAQPGQTTGGIPLYFILTAFLVLSMIPAYFLRADR